jgi:hypothetical protein
LQSHLLPDATITVDINLLKGNRIAYALANPSREIISIRLALLEQDGAVWNDEFAITLGPGEQTARYLSEDMPVEEFRGSVILWAEGGDGFVVVALSDKQGVLTAVPVIPGRAPGLPD